MNKSRDDDEEKMDRLNFTLPTEMKEYVEQVAVDDDRSVSSVMRLAIEALQRERGEDE